jgi:hypothetical protein
MLKLYVESLAPVSLSYQGNRCSHSARDADFAVLRRNRFTTFGDFGNPENDGSRFGRPLSSR